MVTTRHLARTALLLSALSFGYPVAEAATYDPARWFLSASVSYDVINPVLLNAPVQNIAPLQGLISGRFRISRGLVSPDWSHWVEVGFHSGTAAGENATHVNFSTTVTHLSVLPVGITYWFERSAYIDFGLSLAGGVGGSRRSTRWPPPLPLAL